MYKEERDGWKAYIDNAETANDLVQAKFGADCQGKEAAAISALEYCP